MQGQLYDSPLQYPTPGMQPPYAPDYSPTPMAPDAAGGVPAGAAAGAAGGPVGMAIGAGLGILSAIGQQHAYQAKMKQMATTTRFSPWTRMSMAQPDAPNALGQILGYGAAGGVQGQALDQGKYLPLATMAAG